LNTSPNGTQFEPFDHCSRGVPGVTSSIIARDQATGQFGIAVATRFFAVGALVPRVKSRIGAIATQGAGKSLLRHRGLAIA
jgi:uncharacterized Ntn-hydrolase superfamily protein